MRCTAVVLIAVAVLAIAGARAADERFDGLGEYIGNAMADWQVPGLAVVVMHEGETVYSGAFGVREAGRPEPVDLDTVFALSSTGKAYTATLIGTLVDEGRLAWDDPAADYLDHFRLPDPNITGMATLRDLLSHRVAGDLGVGRPELWAFTGLSRVEVLSRLRHLAIGPQRFRGELQWRHDLYRATWIGPWDYAQFLAVLADPAGGPPRIDLRGFGVFSRTPAGPNR